MTSLQDKNRECTLSDTLSRFKRYQKRLQSIYEETTLLLNQNPSIGLQSRVSDCLRTPLFQSSLLSKFSIHILGDSHFTKCQCLNWLLGDNVLPENADWFGSEYQITVKHGTKPQLAVTLPDSYVLPVDFNFDCVLDIQSYLQDLSEKCSVQSPEHCDNIFEDVDVTDSEIEILMNKPLLNTGCKVVLHSKFNSTCHDMDDITLRESFENMCESETPVFIYATTPQLSKQKTVELAALKAVVGEIPVLFWVGDKSVDPKCLQRQSLDSVDSKDSCDAEEFCPNFALLMSVPTAAPPSAKMVKPTTSTKCLKTSHNYTRGGNSVQSVSSQFSSPCMCNEKWNVDNLKQKLHRLGYYVICAKCETDSVGKEDLENMPPSNNSFLNAIDEVNCDIPSAFLSFLMKTMQQYLVFTSTVLNRFHCAILDETIAKVYSLSRDVLITPKRIAYAQNQEQQLFDKLLVIATNNQVEIMKIISSVKEECTERITQLAGDYDARVNEEGGDKRESSMATTTKNIQNFVLQHVKMASVEKLNNNIDVLRESFSGTLSRCLQHLESFDDEETDTRTAAETSLHLKMILNAAYNVDISIQSSSSVLTTVLDKIKQLLQNLKWKDSTVMDTAWKCKIAEDVLENLCEGRLAKHMCSQFRNQLSEAHESFVSALRQLELRIQSRLEREEALKHHASKVLSPKIAQLALQSRSLIDELQYGIPKTGKEIGRGMYGVVYTCSSWALPITKRKKCAVKSVVPQDEKHWNDLSLEFYYSICLPTHPRIVELYGSVIDESYGGPNSDQQAVLLVMERMQRDLYTALKRGLSEDDRMNVGLDVIAGIRYLHSQGLVHRDIKLKNVLLDQKNRAKISDLGFCKPSAMMSGSIVGTPIHMPPELFSGHYDNSVDVYAFGILFWHLCAGSVRLPNNYRSCVSKDHLWSAVRKGTRPERLHTFHDEWWTIMIECWQQDPMRRPLPGILHAKLSHIINGAPSRDVI